MVCLTENPARSTFDRLHGCNRSLSDPVSPDRKLDRDRRVENAPLDRRETSGRENLSRRHALAARRKQRCPACHVNAPRPREVKGIVSESQEKIEHSSSARNGDPSAPGQESRAGIVPRNRGRVPPPCVAPALEALDRGRQNQAGPILPVRVGAMTEPAQDHEIGVVQFGLEIGPISLVPERVGGSSILTGDPVVVRDDGVAVNLGRHQRWLTAPRHVPPCQARANIG